MGDPRFYTTRIAARKSANEIGDLVAKYGARSFGVRFDDDRQPVALHFVMEVPGVGEVPVELQAHIDHLTDRLRDTLPASRTEEQVREQAYRVAWRQLKAYVEMMLEFVENGLKPFHEAFMADVMVQVEPGQYRRLGDAYRDAGGQLALPSGSSGNEEIIDAGWEEE